AKGEGVGLLASDERHLHGPHRRPVKRPGRPGGPRHDRGRPPHGRRPRGAGRRCRGRPGGQWWAARTPDANEVSQTGREKDCAFVGPYTRTAALPRARAMDAQCRAREGRSLTASWRWVSATPGFFSWSSTSSRSRRTSCGAGAALREAPATAVSAAVSTGLVGLPDQSTRATARVPENTRTTGRTRARLRPIRWAWPRPRRV